MTVLATRGLEAAEKAIRTAIERDREAIEKIAEMMVESFRRGGKVLACGNGGSAANAAHMCDDLVGHFKFERPGLPAIALVVDPCVMTALSNDYGYDKAFSRQVESLGRPGDVLIAFSSSGNSPNCNNAVEAAKKLGIKTVGLTAKGGGKLKDLADICIILDTNDSSCAEEVHMIIAHTLCELVEKAIFGEGYGPAIRR
ncbi:MAG: SIS domain-containing protein [Firmicutes bacterium]|nr:SIS domain-containing protein [Bacillota bacterium]